MKPAPGTHGRQVLAVLDQALVSGGTFTTNLLLARGLARPEYGTYAVIFWAALLANGIHGALISYPLSVRVAQDGGPELRRTASGGFLLTAALGLVESVLAATGLGAAGHAELAPFFVLVILATQLQETGRRVFLARFRYGEAVLYDSLSYGGLALAIILLGAAGWLSVKAALLSTALAAGVSALVQVLRLRATLRPAGGLAREAREYWSLGRWTLLSLGVSIPGNQAFPWLLAATHGALAAGDLQAVTNTLGLSHPVLFGTCNLVLPAAARANQTGGQRAAIRVAARSAGQGAAILLPYYAILALAPSFVLGAFYGAHSPYRTLSPAVRLDVAAYALNYGALVALAALNGIERAREAFWAQLLVTAAGLALVFPLTVTGGLLGGLGGMIAANGVKLAVSATLLVSRRTRRNGAAPAAPHPAIAVAGERS